MLRQAWCSIRAATRRTVEARTRTRTHTRTHTHARAHVGSYARVWQHAAAASAAIASIAATAAATQCAGADGDDDASVTFDSDAFQRALTHVCESATGEKPQDTVLSHLRVAAAMADDTERASSRLPMLVSTEAALTVAHKCTAPAWRSHASARRHCVRFFAGLAALPRYKPLQEMDVQRVLVDALSSEDVDVARMAAAGVADLVIESDARAERWGLALLKILADVTHAAADPDLRDSATVALCGCCSKQQFSEADLVHSGAVSALAKAIELPVLLRHEARFACTALRELGVKASENGVLERELVRQRIVEKLHVAAGSSANVWTQRAACKALASLVRRPALLRASGVSLDQIVVTLEAAGKQDFMCARWARDVEKWRRTPNPKKWYE